MDFDIKGFIIALLLGILSGIGFANIFNLDFSSAIDTTGTFLAGVGAVGTMFIAAKALKSWKVKDNFEKSLELHLEAKVHATELARILYKFCILRRTDNPNEIYSEFIAEKIRLLDKLKSIKKVLEIHRGTDTEIVKVIEHVNKLFGEVSEGNLGTLPDISDKIVEGDFAQLLTSVDGIEFYLRKQF
jgi:hypothetical protein